MRRRLISAVTICLAACGACAESLPSNRWDPGAERCAGEISRLHGVWRREQAFLPAYGDLELVLYLAALGARQHGVAVVPVYASDPLCFRSAHVVFLSTGLILRAGSERELADAIRGARVEVHAGVMPACAAMTPRVSATLPDIQQRLAAQLAGYGDVIARRLRLRAAAAR